MAKQAFLHFGGEFCGGKGGPLQTVTAPHKETSGVLPSLRPFGRRIHTPLMVLWAGHWYRVFMYRRGQREVLYIGPANAPIATVQIA